MTERWLRIVIAAVALGAACMFPLRGEASAVVVCKKGKKVHLRLSGCKRNEVTLEPQLMGPPGAGALVVRDANNVLVGTVVGFPVFADAEGGVSAGIPLGPRVAQASAEPVGGVATVVGRIDGRLFKFDVGEGSFPTRRPFSLAYETNDCTGQALLRPEGDFLPATLYVDGPSGLYAGGQRRTANSEKLFLPFTELCNNPFNQMRGCVYDPAESACCCGHGAPGFQPLTAVDTVTVDLNRLGLAPPLRLDLASEASPPAPAP